jgi:hypothetical protein
MIIMFKVDRSVHTQKKHCLHLYNMLTSFGNKQTTRRCKEVHRTYIYGPFGTTQLHM